MRKVNKKHQVQQIRQAMMKHDKKIQKQQLQFAREQDRLRDVDEEDIMQNMTNLILHKNDDSVVKPWQKGIMALDTAANSISTNVLRANPTVLGKKVADNASKKLSNMAEGASMLNPMLESFLSFNINNNTTL